MSLRGSYLSHEEGSNGGAMKRGVMGAPFLPWGLPPLL